MAFPMGHVGAVGWLGAPFELDSKLVLRALSGQVKLDHQPLQLAGSSIEPVGLPASASHGE